MPTDRSMLKSKSHNVLDSLDGHSQGVARKPLTNQNLDASSIVTGVPMVLVEKFSTKRWKLEWLELTGYGIVSSRVDARRETHRMYC